MNTNLLLKMKGRIGILSSEPEPNGANSDILDFLLNSDNDEIKLATAVYFGSTVNLCVYVKTSPSQNAPKSKRPRIGRNVPIIFSASYSPSAMVMYVSKLPWTRVRFGPVPLASCGILATKG